jgi:hypothetical protein
MDAEMSRAYIQAERAGLAAEGQNPDEMLANVRETPVAAQVLRRFASIAFQTGA